MANDLPKLRPGALAAVNAEREKRGKAPLTPGEVDARIAAGMGTSTITIDLNNRVDVPAFLINLP